MRLYDGRLLFSASDLVGFLGCRHSTVLDRRNLDDPQPKPEADAYLQLLQQKGIAHERAYLERLRSEGLNITEIASQSGLADRRDLTRAAMESGAQVIFQGAFFSGDWHGFADFLVQVDGQSNLGAYAYEPQDTKLAHSPKPKHVIQLGVYAQLIESVQGNAPEHVHVVLGTGEIFTLALRDVRYYLKAAQERFDAYLADLPQNSIGEPCAACSLCRWQTTCENEWVRIDHLTQVANISRNQIKKLAEVGITTLSALAASAPDLRMASIQPAILERLQSQARLQEGKRRDGQNRYEMLDLIPGKGFARFPQPSPGDLFFDMEGDPLIAGGLEYLFGFACLQAGEVAFVPFWGHDRAGEKCAFEAAMDFITARLAAYPESHVYHYGTYEESALKRLAMFHGTREVQVDDLLRGGKLVDLYRIVRESLRVSEGRYSIKNLEVFYLPARDDAVSSGGESIVAYERWRSTGDNQLLQQIEDYNRVDCISTLKLRDWLLTLRPAGLPWVTGKLLEPEDEKRKADREQTELQVAQTIERLLGVPEEERPFRALVGHLLEFHRREAKPQWWNQFRWAELSGEELIEDAECLGHLERDLTVPPFQDKRSLVHTFTFPPQDFKLRKGSRPRQSATRAPAGEIVSIDETTRRIQLKAGNKILFPEGVFSLIPEPPIDDKILRSAINRYAESVIARDDRYSALTSILKAELPRVRGLEAGQAIVPDGLDPVVGAVGAVERLDNSHLLVQGPPGAGKTFLSATCIAHLMGEGFRVGVAANSHKAINKLLEEVAAHAAKRGVGLHGVKKCSDSEHECRITGIADVYDNAEVTGAFNLIAGTAWLFARPELDQALDYLFIDEAGQVSLGHLLAMGLSAKNVVLVGDQMQLSQPIQGTHPGRSGQSALQLLLQDHATVPPERGVFLGVTRRMHEDVCGFISEAVYEGRLHAHPDTSVRTLVVAVGADPALKRSGVAFVEVVHEECRQKSPAEAARIQRIYASLLQQHWVHADGTQRPIGIEDILVVSPYNMQVNLLQSVLPPTARVGTVDKFQGQEAAVVIVSMTTSSAEDAPRGLEFLFSRNRLNVAVSRAQSLAIIVANPRLLEAPCVRIEQMKLVNTLCFARAYARQAKD